MGRVGGESRAGRILARLAGSTDGPAVQSVANLSLPFEHLRTILAAMGLRYPERREGFFALAREVNVDPAFPRLLIDAVTASDGASRPK